MKHYLSWWAFFGTTVRGNLHFRAFWSESCHMVGAKNAHHERQVERIRRTSCLGRPMILEI